MANPTGDEVALLKAVAARPDDDLPRLVYADWLDENGRGARAEFIRMQIAAQTAGSSGERVHWGVEADALLAAPLFHFGTLRIAEVKAGLREADHPVR